MTDLTARERGSAAILAFDVVRHSFDPQLVELFEDLNGRHFAGSLPVVPVCQGIPDDTGDLEDPNGLLQLQMYPTVEAPVQAAATIFLAHELFNTPWGSEEDRLQKIADTLLHQMVHLAVQVDALGGAHPLEDYHGTYFVEECNRIGNDAGWATVVPSSEAAFPDKDAASWPDNAIAPDIG
jgi:hypothetical protein